MGLRSIGGGTGRIVARGSRGVNVGRQPGPLVTPGREVVRVEGPVAVLECLVERGQTAGPGGQRVPGGRSVVLVDQGLVTRLRVDPYRGDQHQAVGHRTDGVVTPGQAGVVVRAG